ncbi:MAG: protein phosphatase CheZ [Alphaproteobacteria bacterium]|nr:protein phosphatase CheZ [Alphaproteobacteria bacterium]
MAAGGGSENGQGGQYQDAQSQDAQSQGVQKGVTGKIEELLAALKADEEQRAVVSGELQELGNHIKQMRHEVASLKPAGDAARSHFTTASDELDAIVGATEEATGKILDACDEIQNLSDGLDETASGPIIDQITSIYEACSFQDITGQRISKVVSSLKHIEERIDRLMGIVGDGEGLSPPDTADADGAEDEEAGLLNGPQLPDGAKTQDEIDKLFSDSD